SDTSLSDSPPWGLTTKAIITSVVLLLGALAIWRFRFLWTPLAIAAIIAYLVNPLVSWLQRKTAIRRTPAVLIVYGVLFLILGAASFVLGLAAAEQSARLWRTLPDLLPQLVQEIQRRVLSASSAVWFIGPYEIRFDAFADLIDFDALSGELRQMVQALAGRSGRWLANIAQATVSTLGETLMVLVFSIYMAIDSPRVGGIISDLAHQPGYRRDADRLMRDTLLIWNAYLRGQVILGVVIGMVVALALSLLQVNNALALGVLSGLLEFLPVIGPVLGAGAAVLVALFQPDNVFGISAWAFALVITGVIFLIQQLENNLLVPRIVGDALDLHPIAVMVAVLMGASLAGLLGAVLAAPVVASLKLYGVYTWRKMLDLPPFPEPEPPSSGSSAPSGRAASWPSLFGPRDPAAK
ncbi:MAG: AI-2E family transporter, partial [Caldilineaceae bacterium]|nr:AI-2E family transporter [Caldilineaceae bacterium]